MKKIGRNDPCPCGSGKKYKHCCLGKTAQPDEKGPAQQVMGEIREALNTREFDSLEEAQAFLDRFVESKNRVPRLDFLGLSSEQVYRMLHHPLEDLGNIWAGTSPPTCGQARISRSLQHIVYSSRRG